MSQIEKLTKRLLTIPSDFTWDELVRILEHYGYNEMRKGKTGGSRRKFVNMKNNVIILHKPHPGSIVKRYVLKQIITQLLEKRIIDDE